MWGHIGVGLLGFLIHWMGKAREKQGGALSGLAVFIGENALNLLYGLLSYAALMWVWYLYGIEMFGMSQGEFSGLTFFIGYFSSSIIGTWVKAGRPSQIPPEEPKE